MSSKQHKIYFFSLFGICLLGMFIFPSNINIYIPVVYILLSFLRYSFLLMAQTSTLSDYLITNYKKELKTNKIWIYEIFTDSTINIFEFRNMKKELSEISIYIKDEIELLFLYEKFAYLSFVGVIALILIPTYFKFI